MRLEFENRFRKWRLFKRSSSTTVSASRHRVASSEPRTRPEARPIPPGCHTTPISRKQFEMLLSGRPRNNRLDPVSTSGDKCSLREVEARFEAIKEKSGTLDFGLAKFTGVCLFDLKEISDLGEGTCGRVTHCRYEGRSMAVKKMKRTDNQEESKRMFMDLDVITKCSNPYIIKCIGYLITFDEICICMEMMATCFEKVLQKYRRGLPEEVIGKVAMSVVNALDYLKESHMIMHRDIKPSNILLDWHGNVKLCDFGISGKLIDSKATTMSVGCTAYLAPERISASDAAIRSYDVRADVWSLGITLVQLARAAFPYHSFSTLFELMLKIYEENPPVLKPEEGFSVELCDLVKDCLKKDMYERPKYKVLLMKDFIVEATKSNYDVAGWYRRECMDKEPSA